MDKDIKQQFDKLGKVLKTLATKDELKGLATKADLKNLATKDELKDLASKKDLEAQTKELKAFAVKQTEELARIVNAGFEDVHERIDVRERMTKLEHKMMRIEHALHLES